MTEDEQTAATVRTFINQLNGAIAEVMKHGGLEVRIEIGSDRSIDINGRRVPIPRLVGTITKEF